MIYVVMGEHLPLIKQKVNELINKHLDEINDFTLIKYDLEETSLTSISDDAITYPFGYNHKLLLLSNPYFLVKESKKVKLDFTQTFEEFEQYLDNQSDFTTIIFVVNSAKIDKTPAFNKKLLKAAQVIDTGVIKKEEWPVIAKKRIKQNGANIKNNALDLLIERSGEDLLRLEQEIDKLCLCTNTIELEHVESLVTPQIEENVFALLDNLIDKDISRTMNVYQSFKLTNMEPTQLLTIMASQLRFIYQVAINKEMGYGEARIAEILSSHPYRVKLALRRVNKGNDSEYLIRILDRFALLDLEIKTGQVDRYQAFELFLFKFLYQQL